MAANDFEQVGTLPQSSFRAAATDLGAAFAYKGVAPATTLGVLGFDLGVEVTDTRLQNVSALRAAGNDAPDHLVIPKFHAHKGLWAGFDIGAFVGAVLAIQLHGLPGPLLMLVERGREQRRFAEWLVAGLGC